jgi:hypothetical protein
VAATAVAMAMATTAAIAIGAETLSAATALTINTKNRPPISPISFKFGSSGRLYASPPGKNCFTFRPSRSGWRTTSS